jgi:hypothetical protein
MMWRLRNITETDSIVPRLSVDRGGAVEGSQRPSCERRRCDKCCARSGRDELVDREAITFLARWQAQGAKLRNCPADIEEWIGRKKVGVGNGHKH